MNRTRPLPERSRSTTFRAGLWPGLLVGPVLSCGTLALLDVLDPDQGIPYRAALLCSAAVPAAFALVGLPTRYRDAAAGAAAGFLASGLLLGLLFLGLDHLYGSF